MDDFKLPTQLHLRGGGRDRETKALRRQARFIGRSPVIGELHIRPNRTVPVNVEFVVRHFDQIIREMDRGMLIVQHALDKRVDKDELRVIREMFLGMPVSGPMIKVTDDDPSDDDVIDNPHDRPEMVDTLPAPALPEPGEASDEELLASDTPEPLGTPEAPPDASPEPPVPAEPPARALPAGYEVMTKKDLLRLCRQRNLTVDPQRVEAKQLVDLLKRWLEG